MTMQPGDELAGVERTVTQAQVEAYADAAGDHNPIHLDAEFAAKTPFGRRIAHGMLTLAMVSEMLTSAYPDNWVSGGRLKVRFRAPVFPGETVHVSGEVKKVTDTGGVQTTEITVNVKKDDGEDVITGQAFVQIN
ncbi:MAG: MaoC family dehydratase [Chloroflexi bacterium]|nr:MaoC family dehydratase [Chloroflexota bacterium]